MAIAFTNRANYGTSNPGSSPNVSVTAPSDSCWLVVDVIVHNGTTPNTPTLSGGGLTYTLEVNLATTSPVGRIYRAVAQVSTSPGAYTLNVDFAGQTQNSLHVAVTEVTGASASDVFENSNSLTNTGTGTTASVTLNAFASADNRPLLAVLIGGQRAVTPEDVELTEDQRVAEGVTGWTGYNTTADTTPSCSWTTSASWAAVAGEVQISSGAAAEVLDPFGMSGFFGA